MNPDELFQKLLDDLKADWNGLPDKPGETPQTTLKTLWFFASQGEASYESPSALPVLSASQLTLLRELIQKRKENVPLSYLTGKQAFFGLELLASPSAMIPREETVILARAAVEATQKLARQRGAIQVIDLCTGSGNIALSVAANEPRCAVTGADISAEAVELARQNALHLHLQERVHFVVSDLFAAFDSSDASAKVDLITCNPPYISSTQVNKLPAEIQNYEPRQAFDGGPFGVQVLARLIREAPTYLKPASILCFEVGLGQGPAMANLVRKSGRYGEPILFKDSNGDVRAIQAELFS